MAIINQAYKRDAKRCDGPIYFAGEVYSIYIPAATSDPDFADFRLDVIDIITGATMATDIGVLQQDVIGSGFYNIYASFLWPSLPVGRWYVLAIVDAITGRVKAQTNSVLCEDELLIKNTAIVSYRHNVPKNGVRWDVLLDFWLRIRLPLIQKSYSFEEEKKLYRNVSDGKWRDVYSYIDDVAKIETYNVTEEMHRGIAHIYGHRDVFVNSTKVRAKEGYTVEEKDLSVVAKATSDVYVDYDGEMPASLIALISTFDPIDFSDQFE